VVRPVKGSVAKPYAIGGFETYGEWRASDEHIGLWTLLDVSKEEALKAAGFSLDRISVRKS
jgi:hypothetical protein